MGLAVISNRTRVSQLLIASSAVAALGVANQSLAQAASKLEAQATDAPTGNDIVVTATRRSESVQRVPSAITALPESFLKGSASTALEDVVHAVPGLAYTENSVGQAVLAIRGIQTSAAFGNVESPVSLYYDEVPVLDPFVPWNVPQLELFDVNRVEVLKGPQGTLFGAGALSGAIRVITNKPDATRFEAATEDTVDATKGGDVGYATNWMVNAPLVKDQLAIRAVGYYDHIGGWIENPELGQKNGNHANIYGGRAELSWTPTDNFKLLATFGDEITHPNDSNYLPYGSTSYVANNLIRNYNNDNTKVYNLLATYALNWVTLTSSTSYVQRDAFSQIDFTGAAHAVTGLNNVAPLTDEFHNHNFVQEVRLASASEHPFKWLIGAYVQQYRYHNTELISQAGVADLGYSTNYLEAFHTDAQVNELAGFGEVSYDILQNLTLSAGARYSHISSPTTVDFGIYGATLFDGNSRQLLRSSSYNKLTPKFDISYKPDKDVLVYALAAEGYRAGSINLTPSTDPITGQAIPQSYQPDQLWNYELGVKASAFDQKLAVTADIYYIDWSKIILSQVSGGGFYFVGNAGTAHVKGAEFQITAKPVKSIEFGTSLAYNYGRLISVGPGVQATPGDTLPGSAPFTGYAYAEYKVPLTGEANLAFRADYSYIGKEFSYLNNENNPAAQRYGDYSTVGGQITLHTGPYDFMIFSRNLADSRGRTGARVLYPAAQEILQTPRIVGFTFRAHI